MWVVTLGERILALLHISTSFEWKSTSYQVGIKENHCVAQTTIECTDSQAIGEEPVGRLHSIPPWAFPELDSSLLKTARFPSLTCSLRYALASLLGNCYACETLPYRSALASPLKSVACLQSQYGRQGLKARETLQETHGMFMQCSPYTKCYVAAAPDERESV